MTARWSMSPTVFSCDPGASRGTSASHPGEEDRLWTTVGACHLS